MTLLLPLNMNLSLTKLAMLQQRYDRRVKETNFQVGQFVWYYVPRNKRGRSRKWELHTTGPYRVIQSLNDVNKIIQKSPTARKIIVHVDRLTHFSGETPECWAASDAATNWHAEAPIRGHSATGGLRFLAATRSATIRRNHCA